MGTVAASIAAIVCMVGIVQVAFTKIINRKYRRCARDVVYRFTSTFGIGNLIFVAGSVMQAIAPANVRFSVGAVGFMGLAIMFTAYFRFKTEKRQVA